MIQPQDILIHIFLCLPYQIILKSFNISADYSMLFKVQCRFNNLVQYRIFNTIIICFIFNKKIITFVIIKHIKMHKKLEVFEPGLLYKSRYQIQKIIDRKPSSITYLAIDIEKQNIQIQLKQMAIIQQCQNIMNHYQQISQIDHFHICKLFGYHIDYLSHSIFVIQQYITGDNLFKYLDRLTECEIIKIYKQIKSALQYLNNMGIVHGHLILENIFIDNNKNIKLLNPQINNTTNIQYKPYELIKRNKIRKLDLWQFGVVLVQLVTGTIIKKLASISSSYKVPALNKNFPEEVFDKYNIKQKFRWMIFPLLEMDYTQRNFCDQQLLLQSEQELKEQIKTFPEQVRLIFNQQQISDERLFENIKQYHLNNLIELECSSCQLTDNSSITINRLVKLQKLNIRNNQITDKFTQNIQLILSQLISLNISFTKIGDKSLFIISNYSIKIKSLDISYTLATSQGIKTLAKLTTLQCLILWTEYKFAQSNIKQTLKVMNYRNKNIILDEQCMRQLCKLKLKKLSLDSENMKVDQLINSMSQQSRSIKIIGDMQQKTVELVQKLNQLEQIYLNSSKRWNKQQYHINHVESMQIKKINLIGFNSNFNQLIQQSFLKQNLVQLDISCSQIGQNINFVNLKKLTTLKLNNTNIKNQGVILIANHLHNLTTLQLGGNKINKEGAIAIGKNLHCLTSLNLSCNDICKEGALGISNLKNLKQLDLSMNFIFEEGAISISKLFELRSLKLSYNNAICDDGLRYIAKNLKKLQYLQLSSNNIGNIGALAIAKNLKNLIYLNLCDNRVRQNSVMQIAKNLKRLKHLELSYSMIGDLEVISIAKYCKNLLSLILWTNQISRQGAIAIANNLRDLKYLDLSNNNLGVEAMKVLKQNLVNLEYLSLQNCQQEGMKKKYCRQ